MNSARMVYPNFLSRIQSLAMYHEPITDPESPTFASQSHHPSYNRCYNTPTDNTAR
jgi:hypothetical protein